MRWHMITLYRVLSVTGGANVRGNTLPDMEDLDCPSSGSCPEILLQQLIEP